MSESAKAPSPPRDASTVVVLRDGARGLETYLVKRSRQVDFMGGAHVFPGGRLDAADSSPSALALLSAEAGALRERLGEDLPAGRCAGLFVAGIRETFEEAGLLMGRLAPGWGMEDARRAVAGGALFTTLVERLEVMALVPWVRWITPPISPKRFDARFFLAVAPEGQAPKVDGREATEGLWITPGEAIGRWTEGDLLLPPATARSLDALVAFRTAADALLSASRRPAPALTPLVWNEDGRAYISMPGDPRHPAPDVLGGSLFRIQLEAGRYRPVKAS